MRVALLKSAADLPASPARAAFSEKEDVPRRRFNFNEFGDNEFYLHKKGRELRAKRLIETMKLDPLPHLLRSGDCFLAIIFALDK